MITPLHPSVIDRAIEVVDRSLAAPRLLVMLSPTGRGRRPSYNTNAFLVGSLLSVQWKGTLVLRDVHRVLTQLLPVDTQRRLGVRTTGKDGEEHLITEDHLYAISDAMARYIEWGAGTQPDLTPDERVRRREQLLELLHDMLAVTLPPTESTSRAIDGTGIRSYARQRRAAPSDLLARDAAGDPLAQPDDPDSQISADPDATLGVKTRKDGQREVYSGYELQAMVRVRCRDGKYVPPLFESFELTPAGTGIVEVSLRVLDRAIAMGHTITDLLADRHYSYKAAPHWYYELLARGIQQHVDLHPKDQGFRDYDGMKMAAAWMHCPCTPDRLGTITDPGPTATEEAHKAFIALIDERQQYAFRRVARQTATTGARWECPALNGTVGCPLRQGTVEVAQLNGLPVIVEPPDPATAPKCCTQRTVSTGLDAQAKIEQEHYWGSKKWRKRYNHRTYIEGAFGNVKNPTTENVERGFVRVFGLGRVTFAIGIALIACNLRMLRGNTELLAPGDGDLLVEADAHCHGFMFVTEEEEALLAAHRASRQRAA